MTTNRTSRQKFEDIAMVLAVLATIVIAGHSRNAWAGTKELSGTHSASEIKGSCDKAGGVYFDGGGGYSCVAAGGSVDCNKSGKCTGQCKSCGDAVVKNGKGSVVGVLSGATLKSSPTKPIAEPVKNKDSVGIKKPGDFNKSYMGSSEDHHNKK